MKNVMLFLSIVSLAGCGTIMHGTSQRIGISSSPSGATVIVDRTNNMGRTPVFVDLERLDTHIIRIEMPNYAPLEMTITRKISTWAWGNIIFGMGVGLAIDAISGGLYKLDPERIHSVFPSGQVTISKDLKKGLYIAVVLKPKPEWQKIGQLSR